VIDPIEEIDRGDIIIDWTNPLIPVVKVDELPVDKALILKLDYLPTVDLETNDLRVASQAGVTPVTTSIPFRVPSGGGTVNIQAAIDLALSAPSGGRFVDLDTQVAYPGDNPETAAVENGYTVLNDLRLDYAARLLNRDDDRDGNFNDEAFLSDQDRDCMSDRRIEQVVAAETSTDTFDYVGVDGVISHLDLFEGEMVIEVVQVWEGSSVNPNDELLLYFDEETYFAEYIWDGDNAVEIELFPGDLVTGDYIEIDVTRFTPAGGQPEYWLDGLWRVEYEGFVDPETFWEEGIISSIGPGWIDIDGWAEYDLADVVDWSFLDGSPAEMSDFSEGMFVELTVIVDEFGDEYVVGVQSLEDDPGGQVEFYYGEITFIFSSALAIDGEYFQTNFNTHWLDSDYTQIEKSDFEVGMPVEVKVRYIDEYTERVEAVRIDL